MTARWSEGLWIGKTHSSDEHVICPLDGSRMLCARSVRPLDAELTVDHVRLLTTMPFDHAAGLPVPRESCAGGGLEIMILMRLLIPMSGPKKRREARGGGK